MKLADHLGLRLAELARTDPRIFVLDGDLADSNGAMHFAQAHPQRFLMAGIAEQGMVSMAAGLATTGVRPFVFSFAAFLCFRAYDQIRVGLSQAQQPVTLVGSHAGGLSGRNGKTHAAPNDLALMLTLPSLSVFAPADHLDVEMALRSCMASQAGPHYIRLPRTPVAAADARLPAAAGDLRWLRPAQRVTLVSSGLATHWARAAADLLARDGYPVGLLHCPRLKPFPQLGPSLGPAEHLVLVEDHVGLGGLTSLVMREASGHSITTIAWPDEFSGMSGSDEDVLERHGLSPRAIAQAVARQAFGAP
jgi:transketolase